MLVSPATILPITFDLGIIVDPSGGQKPVHAQCEYERSWQIDEQCSKSLCYSILLLGLQRFPVLGLL